MKGEGMYKNVGLRGGRFRIEGRRGEKKGLKGEGKK